MAGSLPTADALPRTRLAVLPTPLVPAPRLAEALCIGQLLVKRAQLPLAAQCLRLLGSDREPSPDDVTVVDARGPGHGLPRQPASRPRRRR